MNGRKAIGSTMIMYRCALLCIDVDNFRRVNEVLGDTVGDNVLRALGDVRAVLGKLGVGEDDLTTEQYTDAVMRARI